MGHEEALTNRQQPYFASSTLSHIRQSFTKDFRKAFLVDETNQE
jgi:hypothetical protein